MPSSKGDADMEASGIRRSNLEWKKAGRPTIYETERIVNDFGTAERSGTVSHSAVSQVQEKETNT
jgi:hypothetical protein